MSKRKDPAVLFYYESFIVGTQYMTDEEVGKYIRLLCYQFDKGHIPLELVLSICKASAIPINIKNKLLIDENGLYYNHRADIEKEKRIKFVNSRKDNASTSSAYAEHDINKDISINISKLLLNEIIKRKPDFKKPDIEKWSEEIDLMIRIDKRPIEEIKKVIVWCQQDTFWQNNILSTSKLRKQFDQLSLKMNSKPVLKPVKQESPYEQCPRCGKELRKGYEYTIIGGQSCCEYCPEARVKAKQDYDKLNGMMKIKSL